LRHPPPRGEFPPGWCGGAAANAGPSLLPGAPPDLPQRERIDPERSPPPPAPSGVPPLPAVRGTPASAPCDPATPPRPARRVPSPEGPPPRRAPEPRVPAPAPARTPPPGRHPPSCIPGSAPGSGPGSGPTGIPPPAPHRRRRGGPLARRLQGESVAARMLRPGTPQSQPPPEDRFTAPQPPTRRRWARCAARSGHALSPDAWRERWSGADLCSSPSEQRSAWAETREGRKATVAAAPADRSPTRRSRMGGVRRVLGWTGDGPLHRVNSPWW